MSDESPSMDSLIGARARDESGRFVSVTPTEEPKPKTEEPVAPKVDATPVNITPKDIAPKPVEPVVVPPPVQSDPEKEAYKKAMQSEREKRQALQAELEALKKPKPEPVDPWTDLPGALARQRQELQEEMQKERLLISEDLARSKYTDFEEVIGHFQQAVEGNPALAAQMTTSRNPAEFAYRQGLLHRELGSVNGDPIAYRTKLEADIRAKMEAEFKAKQGIPVPASINSDTSPAITAPTYAGPPSLNSLLPPLATRSRR